MANLAHGQASTHEHDDIDQYAVHHGRSRWNADEGQSRDAAFADLVREPDHLVIAHAIWFCEFAKNIPRSRTRAAEKLKAGQEVAFVLKVANPTQHPTKVEIMGPEEGEKAREEQKKAKEEEEAKEDTKKKVLH